MNAANSERFKISKRAAGYLEFPSLGRSCKFCGRFRGDRCLAVQGWIYEGGYCRSALVLARKPHSGATGGHPPAS